MDKGWRSRPLCPAQTIVAWDDFKPGNVSVAGRQNGERRVGEFQCINHFLAVGLFFIVPGHK